MRVNRRARTGKLRRAIQVRDRHCTGLGCDHDARFSDVDHIVPVASGGRTRPDNGRVACGKDNRARPRRRFAGDPDPPLRTISRPPGSGTYSSPA